MTLRERSTAGELMDTDCTDEADYAACLADLAQVNTLTIARRPTLAFLRRAMRQVPQDEPVRVFDVAFGHGDMLRSVARWAARRGRIVQLAGIDLNPDAAATARAASPGLVLDLATGDVLASTPAPPPDYIISSLFTHHLDRWQLVAFLRWMEDHAVRGWFINDLERNIAAYHGFRLLGWAMRWHRFVRHDGAVSVARSFRPADWRALLTEAGVPGRVQRRFPFRLCVTRLR